jgi:hypothetical protein
MALIAPPATVEVYAAPNKIKPVAGCIWKVNGISSATAIVGLRPGVAPRIKPPTVPRTRIVKFQAVKTSGIYVMKSSIG